jgi:hypothetical protein
MFSEAGYPSHFEFTLWTLMKRRMSCFSRGIFAFLKVPDLLLEVFYAGLKC